MAFARFSTDSDVYVYEDARGGFTCCCRAKEEDFRCSTADELIDHLLAHRTEGLRVPEGMLSELREEVCRCSPLLSAGDCPLCTDAGALVLLQSRAEDSLIYYCPMCDVAWRDDPRTGDLPLNALDDVARAGFRIATRAMLGAELQARVVEAVDPRWRELLVQQSNRQF